MDQDDQPSDFVCFTDNFFEITFPPVSPHLKERIRVRSKHCKNGTKCSTSLKPCVLSAIAAFGNSPSLDRT